jgi:hypothetical protein
MAKPRQTGALGWNRIAAGFGMKVDLFAYEECLHNLQCGNRYKHSIPLY